MTSRSVSLAARLATAFARSLPRHLRHLLGAAVVPLLLAGVPAAFAAPAASVTPGAASLLPPIVLPSLGAPIASPSDKVTVMVHFTGEPAAATFAREKHNNLGGGASVMSVGAADRLQAAERSAARLAQTTQQTRAAEHTSLVARLKSNEFNAQVLFTAESAINGIAVEIAVADLPKLSRLPGFAKVTAIAPATPSAYSSIDFLGTHAFWGLASPYTGEGVGVAVIDTGIDFVHQNFGGPGGSGYASGATSIAGGTPATTFPTAKVVWGYDFAGDAYNANAAATSTPVPDANPMDVNGHGTSCASLVAGIGENADGTTYAGAYDSVAPAIAGLRIPPGLAPGVKLYALKVFGSTGSTNLVAQALDVATAIYLWQTAGDSNAALPKAITSLSPAPATLPISPRLRVASLSLGSAYGLQDDGSTIAAQNAVDAGLVVVAAAGNNYDTSYIVSSPANATGAIAVAASQNDVAPFATATAPASGSLSALYATTTLGAPATALSPVSPSLSATATVYANPRIADYTYGSAATATLKDANGVPVNNADGTFNSAATNPYLGNVVLIDRGTVTFHQKAIAAYRAGAVAVVIVDNNASNASPPGMAATAGLPAVLIPVVSVTYAFGAKLTATGAANTGVVRPSLTIALSPTNLAAADTVMSYSSRGPRRSDSLLKPDLTAPAETVNVATVNTGNDVGTFNGTSSATPHVSGLAALLVQMHPAWTPAEIKAQLMNTANHDLFVNGVGAGGTTYGPGRVGAGRVNPTTDVPAAIAYGTANPQAVTVNFGVLDFATTTTIDKTITLANLGATPVTYTVGVQSSNAQPGVSFAVVSGSSVTAPAGGTALVTLRLQAVPAQMRHARDLSMAATQTVRSGSQTTRSYLDEAGCSVTFTPASGPTLRVPAYAVTRRASTLSVSPAILPTYAATSAPTLTFTGGGFVATGTTDTTAVSDGIADITSYAKLLEWQGSYAATSATSDPLYPANLRYVGITSDYAAHPTPFDAATGAVGVIGIVTYGNTNVPDDQNGGNFEVEFDTNNDGVADVTVYGRAVPDANGYNTDVLATAYYAAGASAATATGFYTNILGNAWTNIYNNEVYLLPFRLSQVMGTAPASTVVKYRVNTGVNGTMVSQSGWLTYNFAHPGVDCRPAATPEPYLTVGKPGDTVTANLNRTYLAANKSLGVLALYPGNATSARAQTIAVVNPATLQVTGFAPASGPVGSNVTVTGGGLAGATQVTVGGVPASFTLGDDNTLHVIIPAGVAAGTIRVVTPAGAVASRNRFLVTP